MGNTESSWHTMPSAPGVLYRQHTTRKVHRKADRYLAIRYQREGKRVVEPLGWVSEGWTVEQAAQLLATIKQNIRLGQRPQSLKEMRAMDAEKRQAEAQAAREARLRDITFGELAQHYEAWAMEHRVSGPSVARILRMHVLPELADRRAAEITPLDIQALQRTVAAKRPERGRGLNDPNATLSPQTVLHILKVVREVYNYALETPSPEAPGMMLYSGPNPAKLCRTGRGVRTAVKDSRRLRVLNDVEIAAIFEFTSQKAALKEQYDMILLSLDTGLRCGELCHLRWQDVDVETGAIRVLQGSKADRSTKGGRARLVYAGGLYPEAREMLTRRAAAGKDQVLLFPGRDGKVRDTTAVSRIMSRLAARLQLNAGVTTGQNMIVWHTLRHTYATKMLESGCDVYTLKELMGHASVTTTEGYLHLCDRAKRAAALSKRARHVAAYRERAQR